MRPAVKRTPGFSQCDAVAAAVQGSLPEAGPAPPAFTLFSPESGASPAGSDISDITVATKRTLLRVKGLIPPELWNRFGSKIIPKLRSAEQLRAGVELTVEVEASALASLEMDIQQVLSDLDLGRKVVVEKDHR